MDFYAFPEELLLEILSYFAPLIGYYHDSKHPMPKLLAEERCKRRTLVNACLASPRVPRIARPLLYRMVDFSSQELWARKPGSLLRTLLERPETRSYVRVLYYPYWDRALLRNIPDLPWLLHTAAQEIPLSARLNRKVLDTIQSENVWAMQRLALSLMVCLCPNLEVWRLDNSWLVDINAIIPKILFDAQQPNAGSPAMHSLPLQRLRLLNWTRDIATVAAPGFISSLPLL